jgi:acyl-CoA synthetase (AMP-forming)/AMP-acid ligase II
MPDPSNNIAAHLPAMAAAQPETLAVAIQGCSAATQIYVYKELTAQELEEESNRLAHGLQKLGITQNSRVVLMVKPSIEFFVLTFALFKVGAIPIMIDPGMGIKNLKSCLAEAEPEAFVGITKAHIARLLLGWGRATIHINVNVGPPIPLCGPTYKSIRSEDTSPAMASVDPDDLAAILFTSGSTGIAKGVEYTHAIFNGQVESLRDNFGITPGERDLATFPLFALFGPALGMASIVPEMDASKPITANPAHIIAAIHDYECTNLFASPALIEIVGRYGEANNTQLPSLKRVISAGAPADPDFLARFAALLDESVSILPSYGATEALPVASITHQELIADTKELTESGKGLCIGPALDGINVRIIRITDDPVQTWSDDIEVTPGVIGEICVSGKIVTRTYFKRPESTTLAKILIPESDSFYHRMGDLGYFDDQNRIWFCGRKNHRVQTPDRVWYTIPCERVFNVHPQVKRTALVGVERGGEVVPVICVEVEFKADYDEDKSGFAPLADQLTGLANEFDHTKGIKTFLQHPGFPMDVRHNAKIFREKLALWVKKELK